MENKKLRTTILLICLISWGIPKAQDFKPVRPGFDTIRLKEFHAKKIVAFTIHRVTIFVDYRDFEKEMRAFWKYYNHGLKGYFKAKDRGEVVNADFEIRYRAIDSFYKDLNAQIKIADTIHLVEGGLSKYDLGDIIYYDRQIENGHCAIEDEQHVRYFIILRQKVSRMRGFLDGWGGRWYFLPGHKEHFYAAMDWIS